LSVAPSAPSTSRAPNAGHPAGRNSGRIPGRADPIPVHPLGPGLGYHSLFGNAPAREVRFPALKYSLDEWLPVMRISSPEADVTIKFTGDLTLQQEGTLTTLEFGKDGLSKASIKGGVNELEFTGKGETVANIKSTYKSKLADLTRGVEANWNPVTNKASLKCKLSIASRINGQVFATTKFEFLPPNGFKYTFEPAPIKGRSGDFEFEGQVGYHMEIRRRSGRGMSDTGKALIFLTAGGLVVAGVVIIVADIIKDVLVPPSAAESPLSWAAAAALFARATAMLAPATVIP
jgi:hypothetical protein